jgi:hypothetical protein
MEMSVVSDIERFPFGFDYLLSGSADADRPPLGNAAEDRDRVYRSSSITTCATLGWVNIPPSI